MPCNLVVDDTTRGEGWRTQRGAIGRWTTQQEKEWQNCSLSPSALGMEDDKKNQNVGEKDVCNVLLDLLRGYVMRSKNKNK
jgi:hypothetical protein